MPRRMILGPFLLLGMTLLARGDGGGESADYTLVRGDDRAALERSEWRVVGVNYFGKQIPPAALEQRDCRVFIKRGTIRSSVSLGVLSQLEAPLRLNPDAKPRQIEWENGPRKVIGIYDLQGDTLRIAVHPSTRPTDFTEGVNAVYTLKRVKP